MQRPLAYWSLFILAGAFGWYLALQGAGILPKHVPGWLQGVGTVSAIIAVLFTVGKVDHDITRWTMRVANIKAPLINGALILNSSDEAKFRKIERWVWAPVILWFAPYLVALATAGNN